MLVPYFDPVPHRPAPPPMEELTTKNFGKQARSAPARATAPSPKGVAGERQFQLCAPAKRIENWSAQCQCNKGAQSRRHSLAIRSVATLKFAAPVFRTPWLSTICL